MVSPSEVAPPGVDSEPRSAVLSMQGATLAYAERELFRDLDLAVRPGEFIAVLGPNGSGKTSLIRVLLGTQPLTRGSVWIMGEPVTRGSRHLGYVPQHIAVDANTMVRARDLVLMGIEGHRWGLPGLWKRSRRRRRTERVNAALEAVNATPFADAPASMLSGGELQRIRIAGALAGDPALLLCDEPLAALDVHHQHEVASLIDRRCRENGTAALFVTHDINTIIRYVDRVLYLANGRFLLGSPEQVLTSAGLTALYGAPVEVVWSRGRVVVASTGDPGVDRPHSADDHAGFDLSWPQR